MEDNWIDVKKMRKGIMIIFLLTIGSMEIKGQPTNGCIFTKELIDSLNILEVSDGFKPTKYNAGFSYYDNRGIKITLLKWTCVGKLFCINTYRWRIKCEFLNVTALAWTDDYWIDFYTHQTKQHE